MRSFPPDTRKALHNFGTIIINETPLIDVFCAHPGDTAEQMDKPNLDNIKRRFKKLSFLVHPDRCAWDLPSANNAMQKPTRAKEQTERVLCFDWMEDEEDVSSLVPATLPFILIPTTREKLLEVMLR